MPGTGTVLNAARGQSRRHAVRKERSTLCPSGPTGTVTAPPAKIPRAMDFERGVQRVPPSGYSERLQAASSYSMTRFPVSPATC